MSYAQVYVYCVAVGACRGCYRGLFRTEEDLELITIETTHEPSFDYRYMNLLAQNLSPTFLSWSGDIRSSLSEPPKINISKRSLDHCTVHIRVISNPGPHANICGVVDRCCALVSRR